MKIIILSRYQQTIARGAESFVTELSRQLSKTHQVDIFSGADADNLSKIIREKYDLVIPMNGRSQVLKVLLGKPWGRYKIVSIGQAGIGRDLWWNIVVGKPDLFVALTASMEQWAKRWAWGSRVVKIANGVDLKRFQPDGPQFKTTLKSPVLISVGALEWYKHHELTIAALVQVPKASLLIVGEGSQKQQLIKLAEEKIPGRYEIISAPFAKIPEIYRTGDLFTLPSWSNEAFGIVYLEAMATNLPAIGPDDSNRREIIGQAGVVTNVFNADDYARAIQQALQTKWGNKPRQQASLFSWDKIGQRYLEEIDKL